jgi:putative two-component system response regulator
MSQLYQGKAELIRSNAVRGEQARAMGILFEFSRSLVEAESLDAIVQHTVTATAELMNSRRVSVMLPDPTGKHLIVASAIGIDEELTASILVPVGSGIAGEVYATGESAVFNSRSDVADFTGRYESDFFVSVPLASKALSASSKVSGVLNVTERHGQRPFEPHEIEYLDLVCNMSASAIEQFQSGQARECAHGAIVIGLAKLAEHRDSDTGKHLERVTQYALLLARELRISPRYAATIDDQFLENLQQSMPLHDIGKVSVPDAIMSEPGALTESEFAAMRRHAEVGAHAIQSVIDQAPEAGFLQMARDIAHCHHEWFDGSGYPQGLAGTDIPLSASIAAVADVYDALTTKRPYKEAFPHEKAFGIIRESSGSHFDPNVVTAFVTLQRHFANLAAHLADEDHDQQDAQPARELLSLSSGI